MSNDDEIAAGVPEQKAVARIERALTPRNVTTEIKSQSMSDEQVGIPFQRPVVAKSISRTASRSAEPEIDTGNGLIAAKGFLSSPALTAFAVLGITAFLIIVVSEAFQFLEAVQAAPLFVRWTAYCFMTLLSGALCWAVARLLATYRRLFDSPEVRLDQLRNAALRYVTREHVERQLDAGYLALRELVQRYPIDDKQHLAILKRSLSDEDLATLKSNIALLRKPDQASRIKWIEDCERLFVCHIDKCAKKRVADFAKRVAIKTAVSPTGLIDSLIVATNAIFMIEELCLLYFVRASRWNTVKVTGQLVFNTFISARLEDRIDEIADSLFDGISTGCFKQAEEVLAKVALKRTAEGAANLALFYRLGTAAMIYLRPIRFT